MTEDYRYPEELKDSDYKKIIEDMKQREEKNNFCRYWDNETCPHCGKKYRKMGVCW